MNTSEFNERIDELWTQTKADNLPREARFKAIEALTDEYVKVTGKRPEPAQLDRLATLCLYEEVTDSRTNKMQAEERPIMSDNQYRRKTEGKHEKRTDKFGNLRPLNREVPLELAANVGTDGRDYRYPNRRMLDVQETMDKELYGKEVK